MRTCNVCGTGLVANPDHGLVANPGPGQGGGDKEKCIKYTCPNAPHNDYDDDDTNSRDSEEFFESTKHLL